MSTHTGAEAVAAIQEAVGAVGLGVESPSTGPDREHDLILINPRGGHITINIKQTSLVAADGLAARIRTWSSKSEGDTTIGVVVADRVTEEAREVLRAAGWGWLDLRGHLRIVGQGVFIDTDVPALRKTPGRTDPLAGHVGIEVATFLLLEPDKPAAVRGIASALGRAPSSVSEVLASMRAAGLVDAERRPVTPALFWELVDRWRPEQADVQAVPNAGDGAINAALKIGLDDVAAVGWALGDTVAAATYGAPVSIRSDHPLDFYVPDQATLRRALRLLEPAHDRNGRAATVRVAPVPTICSRRVDAAGWTNEVWPLALPLFVALDLAQDPGRGREILTDWTPPERWRRVW
jgi:hypothetical protein